MRKRLRSMILSASGRDCRKFWGQAAIAIGG
jgi:hypothetical protein